MSNITPTLLRKTVIWSMALQRVYLPLEHFEVMGYDMYSPGGNRCSFANALRELSPNQLQSLSGNGMHAAAVGHALMFLLAATQPAN